MMQDLDGLREWLGWIASGFMGAAAAWVKWSDRTEAAKQKRDDHIAQVAIKAVEDSGKFARVEVVEIVREDVAEIKGDVKMLIKHLLDKE